MTATLRVSPREAHSLDSAESIIIVRRVYHEHCTYLPAMMGWFVFSSLLIACNKYIYGNGHMAFPCPLFLTSLNLLVQWAFSHLACECFPETFGRQTITDLDWISWALISIPCGLITALDLGLSNLSLALITITFYTMIKSSSPIFLLTWAHIFKIEKITPRLTGVAIIIAIGEFITVTGEVDFALIGFLLCLVSSICSGARWPLIQLKVHSMDPPLKTPVATMRLLSPSMFIGMLMMSILVERPWNDLATMDGSELVQTMLLGLGLGTIAAAMTLCEFFLIVEASAVILMIGGVIKEMITIMLGVAAFGDEMTATKMIGMCVVFLGVVLYKITFHQDKKAREGQGSEQIIEFIEADAEELEELQKSGALN